jgi:hypothetical protein
MKHDEGRVVGGFVGVCGRIFYFSKWPRKKRAKIDR